MKELLKNRAKHVLIILSFIFFEACNMTKLPEEKLYQFSLDSDIEITDQALKIQFKNPLKCPIRIWIQSDDPEIKSFFQDLLPLRMQAESDTNLVYEIKGLEAEDLRFAVRLGNDQEKVNVSKVDLPFPKHKAYPLIQGYNSTPSHNTNYSKYALDFGLSVGDTICAATYGYVVGVIEDYQYGGPDKKWRDFANVITIYEPVTSLFTQYVHLDHKGSLVEVGDQVYAGQKIGIAGMTGYTNVPHLHFNCLEPNLSEDGLISIPLDSIGNYKLSNLKRGQLISN
ncbi:MAG: hypothetical protein CMP59_04170 [Flavobacteriales bacterium]|nr:hypothetical protein [Flavobacteriales bacterium]